MIRVGIQLTIARIEPDVDMIFLSNREGSTLGTACGRGETDVHVSGAAHATHLLATRNASTVTVELDASYVEDVYDDDDGATIVEISDRTRVNLTTSRIALGIDGTVGNTMTGQASVELQDVAVDASNGKSTVVDVAYPNWNAISCVVDLSNPVMVDINTGNVLTVKFTTNVEADTACTAAQAVLESMYTSSMKLRGVVNYSPAPPLTKSVMRVPFGVDGTTFDAVSNVVDRPSALSDEAFESLAHACLEIALNVDDDGDGVVSMSDFMADTASPGIKASVHAHKVANALSTLVCLVCPYRIDGRTMVLPTGLKMVGSESWKAEAPRNIFSFDDCDGSGAIVSSLVYRADTVARDTDLAAAFPHIASISNAMAHHMVGIAVLAANAGQADAAGKNGHEAVAGHAIALAIPKPHALKSMINGIMSTGIYKDDGGEAQNRMARKVTEPYSSALYHADDLKRMPGDESDVLATSEGVLSLMDATELFPLAIEGTSPVISGKLYEPDATARLHQIKAARFEKAFEQRFGPGVTRNMTRLHVPIDHAGPDHQFYKHFVEFSVPLRRYGTFQNDDMRKLGLATAQWVLAQPHDAQSAGASPNDLATGNFSMLPLWKLTETECTAIDAASHEVFSNTIPIRKGPVILSPNQYEIYTANMEALKSLTSSKAVLFSSLSGKRHVNRHVISFGALVGNKNALQLFVDEIREDDQLACKVTIRSVPSVMLSNGGNDIGEMPFIEFMYV